LHQLLSFHLIISLFALFQLLLHHALLFCFVLCYFTYFVILHKTTPLLLYFVTYCFTSPCYFTSCFVTCYFSPCPIASFHVTPRCFPSHLVASICFATSPHPIALFCITPCYIPSCLAISPHLANSCFIVLLPPSPCYFLACLIASRF
jgi:hypothetical protein